MPQVAKYNLQGEETGTCDLADEVFGVDVNIPLLHQVVKAQLTNKRHGTASSLTRGEVSGTGRKVYRQKGTGRARHGARTAPIYVGGGIAHGPHPRTHHHKVPRKMGRGALRCAYSAKVRDGELCVVDDVRLDEPKTRVFQHLFDLLGGGNTLLLLGEPDETVFKSARNVVGLSVSLCDHASVVDVLNADRILATPESIARLEASLKS